MYILAIETTGPHCSAAVIDEKGKIFSARSEERLNHLKVLTPMIDALLKECKINMEDIKAVAASRGPGSFTGIRIGVSTARAISQVRSIPCISVPTLYAFAQGQEESCEDKTLVCPILDARRKQVYGCGCKGQEELIKGAPYTIGEFLEEVKRILDENDISHIIFVGDGIKPCREELEEFKENCKVEVTLKEVYQYAEAVAKIALRQYDGGETIDFNSFEPDYMRKAEAQRKLEERLATGK